ncbi:MAG: DUF4955 domain-containing protein [Verrucomicrobiota bacterium]
MNIKPIQGIQIKIHLGLKIGNFYSLVKTGFLYFRRAVVSLRETMSLKVLFASLPSSFKAEYLMRRVSILFLCVISLFSFVHAAESESELWKEFVADSAAGKKPLLPDFSYAGYGYGEIAIPFKKGPLFKVADYGAIPNDGKNDAESIQKAIDDCAKSGGGVVSFPPGVFLIEGTPGSTAKSPLIIHSSNIVLQGSGSGEGGTILDFPSELQPENPKNMWTGRAPLRIGERADIEKPLTACVLNPAPLGSKSLKISPDSGLKKDDRIVLRMNRKGNVGPSFIAPHEWIEKWTNGINIMELHKIQSIENDEIVLSEPLMIDVDSQGDWTVSTTSFISQVGVENLRFRGAWKEEFHHHRDWHHDSGWRGLVMFHCEESWIRNCVFENMNWPIQISFSRQITAEDLDFVGTPGHFGMQVVGTYGVLGLRVRDLAGQLHGPSLQAGSCCTVYHECTWSSQTSFDSHANNPYATLHDQNQGGLFLTGVGGSEVYFPHHLHDFILWNLKVTGAPPQNVSFWDATKTAYGRSFAQVILAGIYGLPVQFESSSVYRSESIGTPVTPWSLWLAQLKRRLGEVPAHFQSSIKAP